MQQVDVGKNDVNPFWLLCGGDVGLGTIRGGETRPFPTGLRPPWNWDLPGAVASSWHYRPLWWAMAPSISQQGAGWKQLPKTKHILKIPGSLFFQAGRIHLASISVAWCTSSWGIHSLSSESHSLTKGKHGWESAVRNCYDRCNWVPRTKSRIGRKFLQLFDGSQRVTTGKWKLYESGNSVSAEYILTPACTCLAESVERAKLGLGAVRLSPTMAVEITYKNQINKKKTAFVY